MNGEYTVIPTLGLITPERISDFAGQCHKRGWSLRFSGERDDPNALLSECGSTGIDQVRTALLLVNNLPDRVFTLDEGCLSFNLLDGKCDFTITSPSGGLPMSKSLKMVGEHVQVFLNDCYRMSGVYATRKPALLLVTLVHPTAIGFSIANLLGISSLLQSQSLDQI